jgi:hypothetical protein
MRIQKSVFTFAALLWRSETLSATAGVKKNSVRMNSYLAGGGEGGIEKPLLKAIGPQQ